MREIFFKYMDVPTTDALHGALGRALEFPDYYGRNLDALWDCLTEIDLPVRLIWEDYDSLDPELADSASAILAVLQEFSLEEPEFQIQVERV